MASEYQRMKVRFTMTEAGVPPLAFLTDILKVNGLYQNKYLIFTLYEISVIILTFDLHP